MFWGGSPPFQKQSTRRSEIVRSTVIDGLFMEEDLSLTDRFSLILGIGEERSIRKKQA
jgi:hypothetical protein